MTDWQPIETAPKDGTQIIGALRDGRVRPIEWNAGEGSEPKTGWWGAANLGEEYGDPLHVTHWMPFPKHPRL